MNIFIAIQKFFISTAQAGVITDAPNVLHVLINVLKFLLSVFGFLAIIAFIVSGIILLVSQGDTRMREKGKKAFQYAIVGVIVALSALILVTFIAKMFA